MTIVIDTREKRPWSFPANVRTEVGTLKQGDYAIKGDARFAIERKSGSDFVETVATGWGRFVRELNRMDAAGFPTKVIIVECDLADFMFRDDLGKILPPHHDHVRCSPQFLRKRIAELTLKHRTSVIFAGNAQYASAVALSIFQEREEQLLCS